MPLSLQLNITHSVNFKLYSKSVQKLIDHITTKFNKMGIFDKFFTTCKTLCC